MRRTIRQVGIFLGLFLVSFYLAIAAGINRGDEAWFLQVLRRVAAGERLYGDVFYGAGPVAVYVALPGIYLFGVEVIVVKAVVAGGYAAALLLGARALQRLGVPLGFRLLFLAANLILAPPPAAATYQTLANTFLMAAFDATIAAQRSRLPARRAARQRLAGAWAGLAFATKQNIGGYALIAALLAIALESTRGERWQQIAGTIGAFLLAGLLPFLPVVLEGSLPQFIDYGLTNKTTYLQLSGIPYHEGIQSFIQGLRSLSLRSTTEQVLGVVQFSAFLLPFVLLAMGPALFPGLDAEQRRRGSVVALFAGAAFLGVFPRADYAHLIYAVPALLVMGMWMLAEGWTRLGDRWGRGFRWGTASLVAIGVIGLLTAVLVRVPIRALQGRLVVSDLPHFRGVLIEPALQESVKRDIAALNALHSEKPVFFLHPYAGFYYLLTELPNVTPFDFPLATAFGRYGQEEVIAAIQTGRIQSVCWERWDWILRPAQLEDFLTRHLRPSGRVGPCVLFR
ncbi:MAG: hypothetical protein RMM07_13530 [Anaerolineae bacterium]|nr:hypothetical protein [Anaerolineae bacterium]